MATKRADIFGGRVRPQDRKRIKAMMRRAPKEMHAEFETMFHQWGEDWQRLMVRQFSGTAGRADHLRNRTGSLRRSLGYHILGSDLKHLRLKAVSAGIPYAAVQEYGGTIKSKRPRGFLTIPLDALKTRAGVTREISARDMIRREGLVGKSKKGKLTFYRSKDGDLYLGRVKGKDEIEPLGILKRQVTIPGPRNGKPSRLGFFRRWGQLGKRRARQLEVHVHKAMQKAAQGGEA